ncbi:hypothetical protein ACFLYD_09355 [Chloroflexota bacterium]
MADVPGCKPSPQGFQALIGETRVSQPGGQATHQGADRDRDGQDRPGDQADGRAANATEHRAFAAAHIVGLSNVQLAFFILAQDGSILDLDELFLLGPFQLLQGFFGALCFS